MFSNTTCEWEGEFATTFFSVLSPGVCSGHGECNMGRCVCNPGWTGMSDVVNFDGYTCHSSVWAERGLWIANLFGYFAVFLLSVIAFQTKYVAYRMQVLRQRASGANRKEELKPWRYLPLVILFPLTFVAYPCLVATSVMKVVTSQRIGVHLPVTITFIVGASVGFSATALSQYRQFEALARGKLLRSSGGREVAKAFKLSISSSSILYALSKLIFIGSLLLQPYGPFDRRLHIILVAINGAAVFHFIVFGVSSQLIAKRVGELVDALPEAMSSTVLNAVLVFMHKVVRSIRLAASFMTILYIGFSLPYMWGYQTFSIGVALLLAVFPNWSQCRLMAFGGGGSTNREFTGTRSDTGMTKDHIQQTPATTAAVYTTPSEFEVDSPRKQQFSL